MEILALNNVSKNIEPLLDIDYNKIYIFVPDYIQRENVYRKTLEEHRSIFPMGYELAVIDGERDQVKYDDVSDATKYARHKGLRYYCNIIVRIAPNSDEDYCFVLGGISWQTEYAFCMSIIHFGKFLEIARQGLRRHFYNTYTFADTESDFISDWLENNLKKIIENKHNIFIETLNQFDFVSIEPSKVNPNDVSSVGRSRAFCKYHVTLHFCNSVRENMEIHFPTTVAECFYIMLLIASSAYNNNEGGYPRGSHVVFERNYRDIKHWTETIVGMLYFKNDVPMIMEKLDNQDAINQGMSKIRKMFRELNVEQVSYMTTNRHECFYLLNSSIAIRLPEELNEMGFGLRKILESI